MKLRQDGRGSERMFAARTRKIILFIRTCRPEATSLYRRNSIWTSPPSWWERRTEKGELQNFPAKNDVQNLKITAILGQRKGQCYRRRVGSSRRTRRNWNWKITRNCRARYCRRESSRNFRTPHQYGECLQWRHRVSWWPTSVKMTLNRWQLMPEINSTTPHSESVQSWHSANTCVYTVSNLICQFDIYLSFWHLRIDEYCDRHLKLLFTILSSAPEPVIRANIIISLGDIAIRFVVVWHFIVVDKVHLRIPDSPTWWSLGPRSSTNNWKIQM